MKFNNFWGGAVTALLLCAGYLCLRDKGQGEAIVETRTDTIVKYVENPIPVDSTVVRYVTIKVAVPGDTVVRSDTVFTRSNSLSVELPISQVEYKDSLYHAWVSGYQPALDSIQIFQPRTTVTRTIPEIKCKDKKWGVGVQMGIGATPTKLEPYIGIGVSYNIFSW